ncbi:MAG: sigma factor-like helix-turn-helix DNA-binding protein [Erysipelotrichales bacterium]
MSKLEDLNYIQKLYDTYKDLLTKKQRYYFEFYYFEDLSLAEIANNENVSRNAVYSNLNKSVALLEKYESILKIEAKDSIVKIKLIELQEKYSIEDKEIDDIIEVLLD